MRSWLLALLVSLPAIAYAQGADSADARKRAKELYMQAQVHYRTGDLEKAAAEFKASYEAFPAPETLFNMAQAHRLLKHYDKAIFLYRQYLSIAKPTEDNRRIIQDRIAELEKLEAEQKRAESAPPPSEPTREPPPPPAQIKTPPAAASAPTSAPVVVDNGHAADKPIYKKGWFWGVVAGGAVVVAAGITLGVVYGSSTKNPVPTMGVATAMGF